MQNKSIKCLLLVAGLITSGFLTSCSSKPQLSFFNYGDYIDSDVVSAFEDEYGVDVKETNFDTIEGMLAKMQSSDFDVIVSSDYGIEELTSDKKLIELDQTEFENYSADRLVSSLKSNLAALAEDKGTQPGFDLLKYAVPYTWGEVGLVYDTTNTALVNEIAEKGWAVLKNPSYKTAVYDASRDVFSIALAALGYDFTNPSEAQINEAEAWLKDMKTKNPGIAYKTLSLLDDLPNHKYDLCLNYSGDAAYAIMEENENDKKLGFTIPDAISGGQSRTNIYADCFGITSSCSNTDLAYKFIDFCCTKENGVANTEYTGYTSPLQDVYDEETSEDGYFYSAGDAYKVEADSLDHFYRYIPGLKGTLEDKWNNIKTSSN